MSADTFHACVERRMKQRRQVLDWRELMDCVQNCLRNPRHIPVVIDMKPADFLKCTKAMKDNYGVRAMIIIFDKAFMRLEDRPRDRS